MRSWSWHQNYARGKRVLYYSSSQLTVVSNSSAWCHDYPSHSTKIMQEEFLFSGNKTIYASDQCHEMSRHQRLQEVSLYQFILTSNCLKRTENYCSWFFYSWTSGCSLLSSLLFLSIYFWITFFLYLTWFFFIMLSVHGWYFFFNFDHG